METQQQIIWQPHVGQQTFALTRSEREILYGGARGGGKTDASVAWLLRWKDIPQFKFLVIRRNAGDLKDWKARARLMWRGTGAHFTQEGVVFPSGATGTFGHLADEDAYERYQGQEYQKIVIEELTHIPTFELYEKLIGSCRSTVPGLKPQIFCTTNPTGDGFEWVKDYFVDVAQANTPFTDEEGNSRIFIPARVSDNPTLVEQDPGYIAYLRGLSPTLRKAWYEGSWETVDIEGAYYQAELNEARANGHIGSFQYQPTLPVYTMWDLGLDDSTAIWFAQRYMGLVVFFDYMETEGESMRSISYALHEKGYDYALHLLPHDANVREYTTGKTRLESTEKYGIRPAQVVEKLAVMDGINAVREGFFRFRFDEVKCAKGLKHLKFYRKKLDEIKRVWRPMHDEHSHCADALRTGAVGLNLGAKEGTRKASSFYSQQSAEDTHGLSHAGPSEKLEDEWGDFDAV